MIAARAGKREREGSREVREREAKEKRGKQTHCFKF